MTRMSRLPTLKVDPRRRISFTYDGRSMTGCAGDTVATALFANGVRIFSRSVKYHRPRGLYSLDGESANAYVAVDGIANVCGETALLREGMTVASQNVLGSPEWDLWGFLDWFHWAMPAGFFYRVFHKPYRFWPFFQDRIRKMAGLGRLNPQKTPPPSEECHLSADVCVLGGGPAGMQAALRAARFGLRVVLLERRPWLGGFYAWRARKTPEGEPLYRRASDLAAELEREPNVRVFRRTFVNGLWGDNLVTAFQVPADGEPARERYLEIRTRAAVVATGCGERPLVFENNERPGVMQPGCAHRLLRTFGLIPGDSAVFSVGDDSGLEAALDLAELGVDVRCVADSRTDGQDPELAAALRERKIPLLPGWAARRAQGLRSVKGVELASLTGPGEKRLSCDVVAASAGLTPNSGPLFAAQTRMVYDRRTNFFLPETLPPRVHAAGRLLAHDRPEVVELSGERAGLLAAADCGADVGSELKGVEDALAASPEPKRGSKLVAVAGGRGSRSFVCFDEDVTLENIQQATRWGFDVPELAKRFTAAGTGPGQGGIPGHNLPLVMAGLRDAESPEILPTTVRPPLVPTLFSTYAGPKHDIFKRTPLHEDQEAAGAIFRRIGVWKRARYFSEDLSCRDEVLNVRNNVGLIDVSTLGKFRIFGPDAQKALNRVYVGDMTRVPRGKVKYSAMVNEYGCIVDDGVITRVGEDDFYFTTSTGRAGMTVEWIRYHCRFEDWTFHLVNLTDAQGAVNLAGPNARAVLQKLTDADLSNDSFPFMGYREIALLDRIPARVMRLGFVGELSYEIHIPASYSRSVWRALMEASREFGIRPFGLEAQNVLRLEKGHVIIGQETEIRTTLHDLGLGFLWHREKPDAKTVGAPALRFSEHQGGRMKLVGIAMDEPAQTPGDGALIVDEAIRGYVCTARFSPTLGRSIALALVDEPLAAPETPVKIFQEGMGWARWPAKVTTPPFYDPEGKRLRM